MDAEPRMRTCNVYRGRGEAPQTILIPAPPEEPLPSRRASASGVPLKQIMSRDLICARPDLDVGVVVQLMLKHHIGCLPVLDERQRPIGIITKSDLVEQIDAAMSSSRQGTSLPEDLQARNADEIMMPLAFTLSEFATVAHAAQMMMAEDTHHVMVVSPDEQLVGVVSTRDIVGWLLQTDGP